MIEDELREARTARADKALELSYSVMDHSATLMKNEDNYALRCELYKKWQEARNIFVSTLELGRTVVNSDKKEESKDWVKNMVFNTQRKLKFEDIVGLEEAVETLRLYLVLPLKGNDFPGSKRRKRILLYGPPGTGKTMLAYAAACEAEVPFLDVKVTDIFSKYLGDTEKRAAAIFDYAERNAPLILHFDEIDAIGRQNFQRFRATLLTRLDGLGAKATDKSVILLGSTNMPWRLDSAFRQRFQHEIYVPPPSKEAKKKILMREVRDICFPDPIEKYIADESLIDRAADMMESDATKRGVWTGRDIRTFAELLFELSARDKAFRGGDGKIREEHFSKAFNLKVPALNSDELEKYERWASSAFDF